MHLFSKETRPISKETDTLLVCGIANPSPLKYYLTNKVHTYDMLRFADHHIFKIDDLENIIEQFEKISSPNKIILTTEKDAVRLQKFEEQLKDFPLYVLPIKHTFLFDEGPIFDNVVISFIDSFKTNKLTD